MRSVICRTAAVLLAVLTCGIVAIEIRHHAMYGHWFGYGWHVDILDDKVDDTSPDVKHVQYVGVTNFSLVPEYIEGCVANDPRGRQIPVAPSRTQTLGKTGWRTDHPESPLKCFEGRIVRRRVWPLMSFYTEPKFVAYARDKGDQVRIATFSQFDGSPGTQRQFVSEPFTLREQVQRTCSKGCVSVRSVSFCEPLPAGSRGKAGECRKIEQWRDRPGSPHPSFFDILCEVENTASTGWWAPSDYLVLTYMDDLIAPTNQYGLADLDTMRSTLSWGWSPEVNAMKLAVVPWLKSGERRVVRISGFDLRPLLSNAEIGDPGDPNTYALWPWWIRVNVRVENREGDRLTTASSSLALIPSDRLLAGEKRRLVEDGEPVRRVLYAPSPRRFW